jgi:hypothetical protein
MNNCPVFKLENGGYNIRKLIDNAKYRKIDIASCIKGRQYVMLSITEPPIVHNNLQFPRLSCIKIISKDDINVTLNFLFNYIYRIPRMSILTYDSIFTTTIEILKTNFHFFEPLVFNSQDIPTTDKPLETALFDIKEPLSIMVYGGKKYKRKTRINHKKNHKKNKKTRRMRTIH